MPSSAPSASSSPSPDAGLLVFRASRLEALIPPLRDLLGATWPDNLLLPQTLVAAHPGMKHWLAAELARQAGTRGVVANLDVLLPSDWIDRLAEQWLGRRAESLPAYRQPQLRWSLHALLADPTAVPGLQDERATRYLSHAEGSQSARRRFQLADRLARIYSQYLVYRPDWLVHWEHGRHTLASRGRGEATVALERDLLGPLWRAVSQRLGAHRAHAVTELIERLQRDRRPRPALHVFGLSHLAPMQLELLRAYAEQASVLLYVPDPCREYWGGLVDHRDLQSGWQRYRDDEQQRLQQAGDNDYWVDQGHPLLARWGRLGQHFFSRLSETSVREDIRHWQDEQSPLPGNRLARLQESLRQLRPELLRPAPDDADSAAREMRDDSLRVHACHTRLRELEVLRDVLLDAFAAGIAPSRMVVMAPDIQAYVPLLASVFGEAGNAQERRLPYHLADVPISRGHRLYSSFRRLLDLPAARVSAAEVVDLLRLPELQRRFDLDDAAVDTLCDWLRHSRVAWALDAGHRQALGVPAISEHSFAWAVDRMLAGYVMSDAAASERETAIELADGSELLPIGGIHGPAAAALGALHALLVEVQAWVDLAGAVHSASAWVELLQRRLDALFRIDHQDRAGSDAWTTIQRFVHSLYSEPAAAGENPQLHYAVVQDLLRSRLDGVPERQRFLMGGVTICGMVPQRAIPFDVVAVLGLNDGEFPRQQHDGGLDLMSTLRRIGDRDIRSDDRYLFLETLMSARQRVHLSYLGEGVTDGKPRNPAAPLAELLAELDLAAGIDPQQMDPQQSPRPWWLKHPLQPFDTRYFSAGDPRLFSYNPAHAATFGSGRQAAPAFLRANAAAPLPITAPATLAELTDYYRNPARHLLRKRLQLDLAALDDDQLLDSEPLMARFEAIDSVAHSLFFDEVLPSWPSGAWSPASIPARLRLGGLLPPGRLGQQAWDRELAVINALLEAARSEAELDAGRARSGASAAIDVCLHGELDGQSLSLRLTGMIRHVFALPDGGWQLLRGFPARSATDARGLKREADLHFGERVPMFLEWALLRLQTATPEGPCPPCRITALLDRTPKRGAAEPPAPWLQAINQWDADLLQADGATRATLLQQLRARLWRLLTYWQRAQAQPGWYFARTSWSAAQHAGTAPDGLSARGLAAVLQRWQGDSAGEGGGERDYAPGYNRLLARAVDFASDQAAMRALLDFALELRACIELSSLSHGAGQSA